MDTICITVVREAPLSASVSPAVRAFDKNADFSAEVNTVITWNDATAVSDIEAGGISIGAVSYSISDIDGNTAALTIKKEYLAAQATGSLALTV